MKNYNQEWLLTVFLWRVYERNTDSNLKVIRLTSHKCDQFRLLRRIKKPISWLGRIWLVTYNGHVRWIIIVTQPKLSIIIGRNPETIATCNWRHQPPLDAKTIIIANKTLNLQQMSQTFCRIWCNGKVICAAHQISNVITFDVRPCFQSGTTEELAPAKRFNALFCSTWIIWFGAIDNRVFTQVGRFVAYVVCTQQSIGARPKGANLAHAHLAARLITCVKWLIESQIIW